MAQLVARLHGMEEVWGSNPHSSTQLNALFRTSLLKIKCQFFKIKVTSVAMTGPHGGTWPDASGLLACEYDWNRPLPASVARRIGHIVPAGSAEPMDEDLQRDQPTVQR
jgi:hypothetical protein